MAVVLDDKDADALLAADARADLFITFTPGARGLLEAAGRKAIASLELYGAFAHMRAAVQLERLVGRAEAAFHGSGLLSHAEAEALRIHVFYHGAALLFLRACLRTAMDAEVFILADGGRVAVVAGFEPFFMRLAARVAPFLRNANHTAYSPLHARLARACNALLARLPGSRPVLLHLDLANPVPARLAAMLAASQPRLAIVQVRGPGRSMAATLRRTARATLGAGLAALTGRPPRRLVLFRVSPRPLGNCSPPASALNFDAGDPLLARALAPALADYARIVRFETGAGLVLARAVAPVTAQVGAVLLDNLIFPGSIAAAGALRERGMLVAMINHGSHTAQEGRLAGRVARLWAAQGRLSHPVQDILLCKAPATAALAREMAGQCKGVRAPRLLALPAPPAMAADPSPSDAFRILHAGNALDVRQHLPFAAETPDEYFAGLQRFTAALAGLGGVRLILKLKPGKAALGADALRGWLAANGLDGFARLDLQTPLGVLLQNTDLVASNLSSAVDEALAARVPVLLESWRRLYRHLPARFDPPGPGGRAAVYAVRRDADLAPMVAAIALRHGRDRLTDAEVAGLSWLPNEIAPAASLARDLFRPCAF